MESLSQSYSPRHYIIADTDKMSEDKIRTFEKSKKDTGSKGQVSLQPLAHLSSIVLE